MVKHLITCLLFVTLTAGEQKELSFDKITESYYSSYELEKQERYREAMDALSLIVKTYPKGYTVNYRLGWLAYMNGNYADAISYYKVALRQYPSSMEVMNGITLIYVAKQDWKRVEEESRRVIQIDYYNQSANYWLASALRLQKEYKNAIKIMEMMTTIYPTSTTYLVELGKSLFLEGQKERATTIFQSILILDPYNQEVLHYLKGK